MEPIRIKYCHMIEIKNDKLAVPVVLFAGILWSFGPLVVRYMDQPELVPWQYIFGRGLTIFILLNAYLYFEEGINFYKNYKKIGKSGLIVQPAPVTYFIPLLVAYLRALFPSSQ